MAGRNPVAVDRRSSLAEEDHHLADSSPVGRLGCCSSLGFHRRGAGCRDRRRGGFGVGTEGVGLRPVSGGYAVSLHEEIRAEGEDRGWRCGMGDVWESPYVFVRHCEVENLGGFLGYIAVVGLFVVVCTKVVTLEGNRGSSSQEGSTSFLIFMSRLFNVIEGLMLRL